MTLGKEDKLKKENNAIGKISVKKLNGPTYMYPIGCSTNFGDLKEKLYETFDFPTEISIIGLDGPIKDNVTVSEYLNQVEKKHNAIDPCCRNSELFKGIVYCMYYNFVSRKRRRIFED